MTAAQTSIIVTLRERFSCGPATLTTLIDRTPADTEIVYVLGGAPEARIAELRALLAGRRHKLVVEPQILTQNRARNLGATHAAADAEYFIFIDNDVIVEPGWSDALVRCAQETGAGIVGPLMFEGDPARRIVHMAGGIYTEIDTPSGRVAFERHVDGHTPLSTVKRQMTRAPVDYVEGHCLLTSRAAFATCGGFDERVITVFEYVDLCLRARAAGFGVWFEPNAGATYGSLDGLTAEDLPLFFKRWDVADTRSSFDAFAASRGLRQDCELFGYSRDFVRQHRGHLRLFDPGVTWHARSEPRSLLGPWSDGAQVLDALLREGFGVSGLSGLKTFQKLADAIPTGNLERRTAAALSGLRAAALLASDHADVSLIAAAAIYPQLRSGSISGDFVPGLLDGMKPHHEFHDFGALLHALLAVEGALGNVLHSDLGKMPLMTARAAIVLTALLGANPQTRAIFKTNEFLAFLERLGFRHVAAAARSSSGAAPIAAE